MVDVVDQTWVTEKVSVIEAVVEDLSEAAAEAVVLETADPATETLDPAPAVFVELTEEEAPPGIAAVVLEVETV